MKEERSIFEYVNENISFIGKLSGFFNFKDYLKRINGNNFELKKEYLYNYKKRKYLDYFKENSDVIGDIDFKIRLIIDKMLNSLNSEELEKYCNSNEVNINSNLKNIMDEINKHEDVDKDRLKAFCKYNLMKTNNMFCMYIYLLLVSYVEIGDERLKNIILKIALLDEFTTFIDDYIIDKMDNPEEVRFYLLKRIKSKKARLAMIDKMKFNKVEEKWWIIFNFYERDIFEGFEPVMKKIDLLSILNNKELSIEQYLACGKTIKASCVEYQETLDESENLYFEILKKYIELYPKYDSDINVVFQMSEVYWAIKFIKNNMNSNIYKQIKSIFKTNVQTENTKDIIMSYIEDKCLSDSDRNNYIKLIGELEITELYLRVFNEFKKDPLEKFNMIYTLKENKNLLLQALKILNGAIDWNSIIGEYDNVKTSNNIFKPVCTVIDLSVDFPEFAMEVYAKALKLKNAFLRERTVRRMEQLDFFGVTFTDGVMESLNYLIKNEIVSEIKYRAKNILATADEKDFDFEKMCKFNLVGKNETPRTDNAGEGSKRTINLRDQYIFKKMDMDENGPALELGIDHVLGLYEEENGYIALVQGDEFGEEQTVNLIKDDNYNLIDIKCTCRKCSMERFCKHVSLALIYLRKLNDKIAKESEKNK